MPMNWTPEADAKLFAGILGLNPDLKLNYAGLAQHMGPECTVKAVMHRVANLKKRAQNFNNNSADDTTATTPTAAVASSPSASPKKRKTKAGAGAEANNTPSKRVKAEPKASTKKTSKNTKVEHDDEDELATEASSAAEADE